MTLDELSKLRLTQGTKKEVINLFYAEAASVVYYMITELGQHRFVNFCRKLKATKSFNKALFATYRRFKTLKDLNRNWTKYLKAQ